MQKDLTDICGEKEKPCEQVGSLHRTENPTKSVQLGYTARKKYVAVAQVEEQQPSKLWVVGSIPTGDA